MSVPSAYAGTATSIAAVVLLTEFLMLRASVLRSQIRIYATQSLVVSGLAAYIGAARDLPLLFALAGLSFALKVVAVPVIVNRLLAGTDSEIAGTGTFGVATAGLLAIVLAAFGFFIVGSLHISSRLLPVDALGLGLAAILVALLLIAVRSDVVSQATGYFSLDNGISLASLVVAAGLPLILEVAFLFDLLVAVVVFGVLMRVHHARAATMSTLGLTRLRG